MPENARRYGAGDIVAVVMSHNHGGRVVGQTSSIRAASLLAAVLATAFIPGNGAGQAHADPRERKAKNPRAQLVPQLPATAPIVAAPGNVGDSPVVIALDAGHGGTNLGAAGVGRGVYEKKVTLALAEQIRGLLAQPGAPEITVVLCRSSDVLVPIRARARCARDSGARAFVSLHANAVPAGVLAGSQRGFEVFVLGPREVEDDATLAALGRHDDADAVWAAHEVRAAAEQSIVLGRHLADSLTRVLGAAARRGIKQSGAALDVLRGTGTAAALVEVGFLDHPEEGARLATPEGRAPIAQAIAAAIRNYVAATDRLAVAP